MSRTINTDTKTRSLESNLRVVFMAKLEYASPVYVHTGLGTITYDSNNYAGVGGLGKISSVEENTIMGASKVELQLSGVETGNISLALNQHYQGKDATIYAGLLNDDMTIEGAPVVLFKGFMDNQVIKLGKQGVITLSLVSKFEDWSKAKVRRYNDNDQQERSSGDKIFQYAEQVASRQVIKADN